jgi:hypothetical protein
MDYGFLTVKWWWEATCCPCSGILKSTCNIVSILIIYILGHISVLCSFLFLDLLRSCATWMMTDKYRKNYTDHKCDEFGYFHLKDWIWPYLLIMMIDFFYQERYLLITKSIWCVLIGDKISLICFLFLRWYPSLYDHTIMSDWVYSNAWF